MLLMFTSIILIEQSQMPFFRPVKTKKRSKRYEKISHKSRVMLLKKVLCDRSEIKESAEQLEINYSTAKTLMRKYKYHGNQINASVLEGICEWYAIYEVQRQRCGYRVAQYDLETVKIEEFMHGTQESSPRQTSPLGITKVYSKGNQPTQVEILQQVLFKH